MDNNSHNKTTQNLCLYSFKTVITHQSIQYLWSMPKKKYIYHEVPKGYWVVWDRLHCQYTETEIHGTNSRFTEEKKRQTQEWSTHISTHYPSLCLCPVRGTSRKSAPAKWSLMMLQPFVDCPSGHFPSIINALDFNTALGATHPALISQPSFTFHSDSMWKRLKKQ